MSGNIVGGVIGAVIGFMVGGPVGAQAGWMIGSVAGGLLMPADAGPDLTDLKPQSSEYGRPIPIIYGTTATGGNIIWAADLIKGDDAGGKGGDTPSATGATHYANFAVVICESSGGLKLGRIWSGPDKRLVYDPARTVKPLESGTLRYYDGSESQLPDSLMEAAFGVGNVPAYRGYAYVVIEGFNVTTNDGNRIPFLTFEMGRVEASQCPAPGATVDGVTVFDPPPVKIADLPSSDSYGRAFQDRSTGMIYWQYKVGSNTFLGRVDPASGTADPSPLALPGDGNIAWNNMGGATYVYGSPNILTIDLTNWLITGIVTHDAHVSDTPGTSIVSVGFTDVAWSQKELRYVLLANSNEVNYIFGSPPTPALEGVNAGLTRGGYSYDATSNSAGERFGGTLLPIGLDGVAGNFPAQSANYSDDILSWDGYDSTTRMLVSFSAGSYSTLTADGYDFVNTSDFGGIGGANKVVYSPEQNMFFVVASDGIRMYDPTKVTPETWPPEDCIIFNTAYTQGYEDGSAIPVNFRIQIFYLPKDPGYLGVLTGGGDVMKIRISGEMQLLGEPLADVVTDLSIRAGLTTDQIDVTELTDVVDGYELAAQVSVKDALAALMPVYYFDCVEDQGKLVFVKRGRTIDVAIPDNDLGVGSTDLYTTTRQTDEELPCTFSVTYVLAATKYSMAVKYTRRLIGFSQSEQSMQVPMVLSDQKALEVAQVNLHTQWIGRLTYKTSLGVKYSYLRPTDVIGIDGNTMRITKQTLRVGGIYDLELVRDDSDSYTPIVIVEETPPPIEAVVTPGLTILEIM